ACAQQELVAVAGLPQRLRGDRAHFRTLEAGQPFGETGEGVPAPLHGLRGEIAGTVETVALADGLFDVLGAVDLAVIDPADFQSIAVRAQIDRGEAGSVLHVEVGISGLDRSRTGRVSAAFGEGTRLGAPYDDSMTASHLACWFGGGFSSVKDVIAL